MRVPYKKATHKILLILCLIVCVCLLLTQTVSEKQSEDIVAHQKVQIPSGMRIFTVPVSDKIKSGKSLLYPGCFVDVKTDLTPKKSRIPDIIPDFVVNALIKCKLIRDNRGGISVTMLRGIQVLSIKRGIRGTFVNLLVTPKQAEALQLAMKNSTISVTVRKPREKTKNSGAVKKVQIRFTNSKVDD